MIDIRSKIEKDTPDYICCFCPQEYGGICRAYSVPHSDEEEEVWKDDEEEEDWD